MDGLGLLTLLLGTAFTAALALLIFRLVRVGRPSLDAALLVFVWIFVVTLDLLLHGLAGALSRDELGVASAVGLAGIALIPSARRALLASAKDVQRWGSGVQAGWRDLPGWLRVVTIVALSLWSLRFIFLVWALPPFVWDSLTYHLTNIAHWIQAGRIEVFDAPVVRIYSPANYEVFAAWFAVFFHHDGWVEASGLPAYLLVALSVYATARRLSLSPSASWIAALAMASTPALVLAATGTKNDPIVAAVFLCMAAVVVDLALNAAEELDRPIWPRLLALVAMFLYALGTKPYVIHLVPGLLVMGVLLAGGRRSALFLRILPRRLALEWHALGPTVRIASVGLLASALVLGSYWYGRNQLLTGNPFFPYGLNLAGTELESSRAFTFRLDVTTLWRNLQLAAEKFGDKQGRISPDLPDTTGWGWVAYGMGLPALVWAVLRKPTFRALALGFFLSGLTLLLSSPTSPWNMRYMAWFPALLCLAIGAAYEALMVRPPVAGGFAVVFATCLALNFASTVNYNMIKTEQILAMLKRPFRDRQAAYIRATVPYEYENALVNVPAEAILGFNVHSNGFIYPLYRADFSQRLAFIPIDPGETCDEIAAAMRSAGTRSLVGAPEHTDDAVLALLHACGEDGSVLRELGVGLYVLQSDS